MKKTFKNFGGLEYVTLTGVPVKRVNGHEILGVKLQELERQVAVQLLELRVPIRGRELSLITSASEVTLNELAALMGVTKQTVINWRKKEQGRLAPAYEALFRVIASERLGVELKPFRSDLLAEDHPPKKIKILAA